MKIIFMGTPDFAAVALQMLYDNPKHVVAAVVTQPDKPKGRGKTVLPPPVKELALRHGTPVFQPTKLKPQSFSDQLAAFGADIFVVAAYGRILPATVLNIPPMECICIHPSILPKYRGAAPIQRTIMDGETETGITIMYMDKGIDTGDILLQRRMPIQPSDTYGSLHDKLASLGADTLIEALTGLETGELVRRKQGDEFSYAGMITPEDEHINWSEGGRQIINRLRGLNPMPGAFTVYRGQKIKIFVAEEVSCDKHGECGSITDVTKKGFVVKTGDGHLLITEIQPSGKKRMSAADYLRGHKMEPDVLQ